MDGGVGDDVDAVGDQAQVAGLWWVGFGDGDYAHFGEEWSWGSV